MAEPPPEPAPTSAPAFKLRFAAQREPGRSYVSAVKPRALPATVAGKFYTPATERDVDVDAEAERRVRDMFALGPREALPAPRQESHEYGWWGEAGRAARAAERADRRRSHPLRDSAWLKARLQVLAADDTLTRK